MGAQPGIIALGNTDHCDLELDATCPRHQLVRGVVGAAASLAGDGVVNAMVGFRP